MGGVNGNGRTPIPFKTANDVPIVGQPLAIEGWLVQVLVTCRCEKPRTVLVIGTPGQAAGQCPSCAAVLQLTSMGFDAQGRPQFGIRKLVPQVESTDAAADPAPDGGDSR